MIPESMVKPPKLVKYDRKRNPDEHVELLNDRVNYFSINGASKCKYFTLTLIGPSKLWFNGLTNGSITSWMDFCGRYYAYFIVHKRQTTTKTALSGIVQGKKENLLSYIDQFTQVIVKFRELETTISIGSLRRGF